jgi:hypothetical protein
MLARDEIDKGDPFELAAIFNRNDDGEPIIRFHPGGSSGEARATVGGIVGTLVGRRWLKRELVRLVITTARDASSDLSGFGNSDRLGIALERLEKNI